MLFKVVNDKEIHIIKSQSVQTLQELRSCVPQVFKQHPLNFYLAYIDEDGDQITLETDSDYNILIKTGLKSAKILIKPKIHDFEEDTQKIQIVEEDAPKETMSQIEQLMKKDLELNEQSEIKNSSNQINLDETIEEKLKLMLPEIISKIKSQVSMQILNKSQLPKVEEKFVEKSEPMKFAHRWVNCDGCGQRGIIGIRYKCAICPDFDYCEKCEATLQHDHPFLKIKNLSQSTQLSALRNSGEFNCPAFGQHLMRRGMCPFLFKQDQKQEKQVKEKECKKEKECDKVKECEKQEKLKLKKEEKEKQKKEKKQQKEKEKKEQKEKEKKEKKEKKDKKEDKKQEQIVKDNITLSPSVTINTEVKLVELIKPAIEEKIQAREVPKVQNVPEVKEEKDVKKQIETNIIENANYLADILDLNFTRSYKFSTKYPEVNKETLLELYFNEKRI